MFPFDSISGFCTGDFVRVISDSNSVVSPFSLTAGACGVLGRICRIKNQKEVWELQVGPTTVLVMSTNLQLLERPGG